MKRIICLVLLVCFCLPVYAGIVEDLTKCEEENKALKEDADKLRLKYMNSLSKNILLETELNVMKEENELPNKIAKYGLLTFGIWGIATWGATGGLYPFVTGCLFLRGAMK